MAAASRDGNGLRSRREQQAPLNGVKKHLYLFKRLGIPLMVAFPLFYWKGIPLVVALPILTGRAFL